NIVVGIETKGTLSYSPDDATVWHGCSFVNDVETPHVANVLSSGLDAKGNIYITGVGGYIRTSSDHGVSWSGLSTPTQKDITGISIYPNGDRIISTNGEGIFRSTDGGLTWDQLNSGIANRQLYCLALGKSGDLFAGGIGVIYYSSNRGLTWSSLSTNIIGNNDTVRTLRFTEKGNIIALVDSLGVYWSSDYGNSWQVRAGNLNAKRINALISTRNELLFAATDNGMFMLDTIIGSSWQQINDGLTTNNVFSICQDYKGRLYIGTEASGVFRSSQLFDKPSIPEAVKQTSDDVSSSSLGTIYPNPSQTKIAIPFTLEERGQIQIEVIDVSGKTIALVEEGHLESGTYESSFDASTLPNGTYIIRMNSNGKNHYQQFVVAK
ncbi:MAG TPA: T9SS type A sorting domain-containing protein, partial [Candidatus Kapabacteria bacterium]